MVSGFRLSLVLVILLASAFPIIGQPAIKATAPEINLVRGQEFIKVPEHLVAEGVPPVPTSLSKRVVPYLGGYGLPLAGWDTVKREVWLKTYENNEPVLSRLEAPESLLKTLYRLPNQFYDLYHQPGERYLAYTADKNGDENFQLYLFDLQSQKSTQLTDGRSRNVEPVWSNRMDKIIFGSTPVGRNGMDLYVIDSFQSRHNRRIAHSPGNMLQACDWSPDDKQVLYLEYLSNRSNNKLWIVDVKTGVNTLLTPKAPAEQTVYDNPHFSADGKGVYLITNRKSEFRRLAYFDLTTKQYTFLSGDIKWDVDEFALSPDGNIIAFVTNEGGISKLYLLDTKTQKVTPTKWAETGLIAPQTSEPASHLRWHQNSIDFAFDFVSPRTPNDVYSLNTKTGEFTRWSKSISDGVPFGNFSLPRLIHWQSFDGLKISGFLYLPPERFAGPRPVMIDIHGGPEEQHRPAFNGEDNFYLNELGVAKIYPNVRGSIGYGSSFLTLDDGSRRGDAVKDIGALLDWIKTQPYLDAKRVMVRGGSYGGYLALSAAATYGNHIRAAVSEAGPTNLVTFLENTEGWRRDQRRQEYGDERDPKVRAFLERIAPRNNTNLIKSPLLLVQGQNDPRVKAGEAKVMVEAVRRQGTPVWYLLGKNEGHGFSDPDNYFYQTYATVLFVQEYLLK